MIVIASSNESESLAIKIAEELQAKRITIESKIFPDGESYLRFDEDFDDQDLIIIKSGFPQQDKRLTELLFLLDTAKQLKAKRTIAVIPYLAYARQDRRFRPGEVISSLSVDKLLWSVGTDLLITVDVHQKESVRNYKTRTINVSAMPLLAEYLKKKKLSYPCILAPDKGASSNAQLVASILQTDYTYFEKHRDRITGKIVTVDQDLKVNDRDVVILDDIISTGTTIANVAKIAKKNGAKKIIAACTHALLVENAIETMNIAGINEVIGTDTITNPVSKVSVAPIIAASLRQIL